MAATYPVTPESLAKAKKFKSIGIILFIGAVGLVVLGGLFPMIQILGPGDPFTNGIIGFMAPVLIFMFGGMAVICVGVSLLRRGRLLELGWKPGQPYPAVMLRYPPRETVIVKEIVKIRCKFCGTLVENTESICPNCGGEL